MHHIDGDTLVKVFRLGEGTITLEHTSTLASCFPDVDCSDEIIALRDDGAAYVGGGSAPAYLLVLA